MDSQTPTEIDNASHDIQEIFKIDDSTSSDLRQKHTIIKYTKIPDYSQLTPYWSTKSERPQVRIRNFVGIEDKSELRTTRSLKPDVLIRVPNYTKSRSVKRKVVKINESKQEDYTFQSKSAIREDKKTTLRTSNVSNRAISTDRIKTERDQRKINVTSTKSMRNTQGAKYDVGKREVSQKVNYKREYSPGSQKTKLKEVKVVQRIEKNPIKVKRSSNITIMKNNINNYLKSSEKVKDLIVMDDQIPSCCSNSKRNYLRPKSFKNPQNRTFAIKQVKNEASKIIHVPLENKTHSKYSEESIRHSTGDVVTIGTEESIKIRQIQHSTADELTVGTEESIKIHDYETSPDNSIYHDVCIKTDTKKMTNQLTNTDICNLSQKSVKQDCAIKKDLDKDTLRYDSLYVPNVSLAHEKYSHLETKADKFKSKSSPDLQLSYIKTLPRRTNEKSEKQKRASFIISRATLTYTTKQKINVQVVANKDKTSMPPKIVASYPLNVVSVFKEIKNKENKCSNLVIKNDAIKKNINQNIKSREFVNSATSDVLSKPSDIINSIRLNRTFIHSDYICDQFQKELNFIDSFFESLQYLERSSLTEQIVNRSIKNKWSLSTLNEFNNVIFSDHTLSRLDNPQDTSNYDIEKIASKSLCLLNLLIRDEQRRAKNLLFVLKMREDALKDFTKSQILWLESKKKYENTDISALKKKQRGALLKMYQECGEMHRMRKALLTLSEKRKTALMKTKKNIELKLSKVDVENKLLHEKRKLRRSPAVERAAPIKCFELSSSGCDDSGTCKNRSELTVALKPASEEKCVQTSDIGPQSLLVEQSDGVATENNVIVDGSYLNILFHNLTLPEIFSSGKEYEVNKEALKNIVQSANTLRDSVALANNVVLNFVNQFRNSDKSKSSSPSTARSLVEEFDQYYEGLNDQESKDSTSPEKELTQDTARTSVLQEIACKVNDNLVLPILEETEEDICDNFSKDHAISIQNREMPNTSDVRTQKNKHSNIEEIESHKNSTDACTVTTPMVTTASISSQVEPLNESETISKVDVATDTIVAEVTTELNVEQLATQTSISLENMTAHNQTPKVLAAVLLSPSVSSEAEELTRQQLAIEREIKALEQQQCQLLVLREIPDKPPPPYTPPAENRSTKPRPKSYTPDHRVQEIVVEHFNVYRNGELEHRSPKNRKDNEPFAALIHNYCEEMVERQKIEKSDKPWHPYNLLPKRQEMTPEEMQKKVTTELYEVLSVGASSAGPGPGTRRASDHIDDILFAEWRRCETEWTNLQADEALVKNQVFESIFQKILDDTIIDFKTMFFDT